MILVNGAPVDSIAVSDRGLQYGDGLFETLAVYDGNPNLWKRHLKRLAVGCERLGIPMPDSGVLWDEAERVCTGMRRGVLKLIITRGSGGRGYRPPKSTHPTRIASAHPWPTYPDAWWHQGVTVRVCRQRLARSPRLAGIKHLNRLEQVLARSEWHDPLVAEGLMLDYDGRVIEGTQTNLFAVRHGRLMTPDLSEAGVQGIMRGLILDIGATLGFACDIGSVNLSDLFQAEELFLCNSLVGIWPVKRLEDAVFRTPGPLTAKLTKVLRESDCE